MTSPSPELRAAVVQDARDGRVLMLAWMDEEALRLTMETGEAHFWSRSRQALWRKGETSGNTLAVVDVKDDCDGDAVLVQVEPAGPACHTGSRSCFAPWLWRRVAERAQGVFTDVVVIGGIETNIYTAWRFLVQDFSFAGPFAIVLLFAVTYRYCVLTSSTRAAWFMLVMLMFTTFLQPNTTLFVHNSITLAALLCAAITARYIRPVKI